QPLMKQLGWPTILCNSPEVDEDNMLTGIVMRQEDGKRKAIDGFRGMGFRTFAAGDSYNDLTMIHKADKGCLFRAPERILKEEPDLHLCVTYEEFLKEIKAFVENC
ncbi:MAG: bifunctional phosphoserine phosphatase/homoserine phosphotransferase ThrH, partial [Spirochaetales bacterium]|nr:bifunctional phosphoserine phosphatase/homoserine phosphotransferase ThrH [Candidatus Physcosoma equi]